MTAIISLTVLFFFILIAWFVSLRRVVATNEVHIVQSRLSRTSYGGEEGNGNAYYAFPSFLPLIGITHVTLPTSIFDLDLKGYEAYDKGRLPFLIDIKAFFRIVDFNLASQRVKSFEELKEQLLAIVQSAVRSILANSEIENIMSGRSEYGEMFTREIKSHLINWGVESVRNIELMDIRDAKDSQVIANIMAKKKSFIEMESRQEIAENNKRASIVEITAKQEADLQKQVAEEAVGRRTAEKEREVGIANQKSQQEIKEEERITRAKEVEVLRVTQEGAASVAKSVSITKADQDREVAIRIADAALATKQRESEGIRLEGEARANAEEKMQMVPVTTQVAFAREVGENKGYQQYLVSIKQVEAHRDIGISQASALQKAEIKVIVNAGTPNDGLTNVMDLFSSKGGTAIGAMLEAASHTTQGKALLETVKTKTK